MSLTRFLKTSLIFIALNFSLALGLANATEPAPTPLVAITEIVDHPALIKTREGVIDGLKEGGYIEGKNLRIISDNAQGNISIAAQIAQKFVSLSPSVIVPISTPSAQTVATADIKAQIPIVFATVTDPIAAQLVTSLTHPGGHITGVIDMPPLAEQATVMKQLMPTLKKLGVIYNAAEINSVRMVAQLKSVAPDLILIESHAASSNEVTTATRALIGKVDALYVPMDNTVITAITSVIKIATENNLPVFTSEQASIAKGALSALIYDQYQIGKIAGNMVAEILNGKQPGDIPVAHPPKATLYINMTAAQKLGIKIPKTLEYVAVE